MKKKIIFSTRSKHPLICLNTHRHSLINLHHCLFFKEMTLNKMVWSFWHQFQIRFSMLFQMVPFILLSMVAHLTITWLVETIPTANQRALCWWFLKVPWREERKVPSERAMKTESETVVKSDTPFCSRLPIKKTNSMPSLKARDLGKGIGCTSGRSLMCCSVNKCHTMGF